MRLFILALLLAGTGRAFAVDLDVEAVDREFCTPIVQAYEAQQDRVAHALEDRLQALLDARGEGQDIQHYCD